MGRIFPLRYNFACKMYFMNDEPRTTNKEHVDSDVLVRVSGVSKKFYKSLKRSLWYGVTDLAKNMMGMAESGKLKVITLQISGLVREKVCVAGQRFWMSQEFQ